MPIPIQKIEDKHGGKFLADYSLLLKELPKDNKKRMVKASDEDATLLLKLWSTSDKISEDVYNIKGSKFSQDDILRLKAHGFLTGGSEEVKFTSKAKVVLTTMVLGESNNFQKAVKKKSYTEILASMDHRGKSGYRAPKYAANNSNLIKVNQIKQAGIAEDQDRFKQSQYEALLSAVKNQQFRSQFPAIQPAGWKYYEDLLKQLGSDDAFLQKLNEKPSKEYMAEEQKRVQQMNADNARKLQDQKMKQQR